MISGYNEHMASVGVSVFTPGEGGYPCIRIPAIAATNDGTLVAFAECRAWIGDGCQPHNMDYTLSQISDNVNQRWICQKISNDNGATWSNLSFPFGLRFTSENPTVVYDYIQKRLLLQANVNNGQQNQSIYQITSSDNGKTWSKILDVGNRFLSNSNNIFIGPSNGVQLLNNPFSEYYGRILWSGHINEGTSANVHVWYSDDWGMTYNMSISDLPHMQESALVELSNGSVVDNMRNAHIWECDCRGMAISNDYGKTFSSAYPAPQLISPECEGSTISIKNGSVIFFSNPSSTTSRVNMTVKRSINNGETWDNVYKLCEECDGAYSCLTPLPQYNNTKIGLLWETNATNCTGPSCQTVFSIIPADF